MQNYRQFATVTLPGLMGTPEYAAELSMLKTRCESRPSALASVMKDGYSALPLSRMYPPTVKKSTGRSKLCAQPTDGKAETEKTELNFRNDIGAWIGDLLSYAFGDLPPAVSYCYYPGDLSVTRRVYIFAHRE